MDLDPKDAVLGYKFDVDPKKSIIQIPSSDLVAFNTMLDKVKSRIARACTCAVVLEIHDLAHYYLFCREYDLTIYLQAAKQSLVASKKNKRAIEAARPSLTTKQTCELQLLKRKLRCAEEHHPWCWVAPDGTHKAITIFQVTLWAQMIVNNVQVFTPATIDQLYRSMGQPRMNNPPQFEHLITSRSELRRKRRQSPSLKFTSIFHLTLLPERRTHHPRPRLRIMKRLSMK